MRRPTKQGQQEMGIETGTVKKKKAKGKKMKK